MNMNEHAPNPKSPVRERKWDRNEQTVSIFGKQAPNLSIINCILIVILRASVGHDDDDWDFWSTD